MSLFEFILFSLTFLSLIKMEDLFKKFVYTGVGMVSSSLEKFQKSVEKLVDEDKLSQEEGKKLVDDLFKNTESKREEFETKLKKVVEEVMVRMNLATQTQVQELQDRRQWLPAKTAELLHPPVNHLGSVPSYHSSARSGSSDSC